MGNWVNMLKHRRLDTFPYIYGPESQRLSSTAVYPPCPRVSPSSWDGCPSGHGGYTAKRWAAHEHEPKLPGYLTTGAHQNFKKFVGFSGLLDIIW
jgi:hypothetical protein